LTWMGAEVITDETLLLQEHPPTEEHAFILTGSNFFAVNDLQMIARRIKTEPRPSYYKFRFGENFMDTSCEETISRLADLTVWEMPEDRGFYSIGGDPAFGSSDWADRFAISVWRCYADRFEQVAEYCVTDLTTYKFAWVMIYLAGAYKQSLLNLEVSGPGQAVLSEITNLRRLAGSIPRSASERMFTNVLAHMQYYLYRRLDSPGGSGQVYHYKTTRETKERMLNNLRDLQCRNQAVIRSLELVEEMKIIVREEDGSLGASGRGKDDRVIAGALAAVQYVDQMRSKLEMMKVTWADEARRREQVTKTGGAIPASQDALSRNIGNYLQQIGIKPNP